MIEYKGRKINLTEPVRVYKNLHNGLYSIQQKGLIVAHAANLQLIQASFVVNERGRQWVINNKRKTVHAYATGFIGSQSKTGVKASYNPYRHSWLIIDNAFIEPVRIESINLNETGMYVTF